MARKHQCPVRGCRKARRASLCMCKIHFDLLTKHAVVLSNNYWTAFTGARHTPAFKQACDDAVAFVNAFEARELVER